MVLEDPSEPFRWVEYGRFCEEAKNDDGAIQAYGRALELDSSYVPAYEHLGAVYSKVGQRDMAMQTYARAFANRLESSFLWLGYGYCLIERESYDPALEAFGKAELLAETPPTRVSALLGSATVLAAQGDEEQAEAKIKAAAAISPEVLEILAAGPNEM